MTMSRKTRAAAAMDGVGQFAKLPDAVGPPVKFHQRRVDGGQVQARVRTAKAAEAGEGGGRGIDRQQLQNPAAQSVENVRQLARSNPAICRKGESPCSRARPVWPVRFQGGSPVARAFLDWPNMRVKAQ